MTALESIIEELKTLPNGKLEEAASYIHILKSRSADEHKVTLKRLRGSLSDQDASELTQIIEEGCEKVDENGW